MLDAALFVSDAVFERELTLEDGSRHKLWFKQVLADDLESLQSVPEAQRSAAISKLIAKSLCLQDGAPAITAAEAAKLVNGVRNAVLWEIRVVNRMGATVGKASPPEASTGSGTSSSSTESAAEQ